MTAAELDIRDYKQSKRIINLTDFLTTSYELKEKVKGVLLFILLIPVLILAIPLTLVGLAYYPLLIFALNKLVKQSIKVDVISQTLLDKLDYNITKDLYDDLTVTIEKLKRLLEKESVQTSRILVTVKNKLEVAVSNFECAKNNLQKALFVDTSKVEYTDKELTMFSELEDFFGEKEAYAKDTFTQLKSSGA